MNKISTRILQLSLLSILFSLAFSASAEEYKSMIRYDRVWEHISIHWNNRKVFYVKFDGPEEINGKTYHKLVAFRKANYDYDTDSKPYLFDVDNNYYEHEGYMREEDGKVYTLIVKDNSENEYQWMDLYTPERYKDLESYTLEEKLLYDFTCNVGESYRAFHLQEEIDYKVKSIDHVEIDGEEHRLLRVATYDEWYGEWMDFLKQPIVESIGIAGYGCLTIINFLYLPSCPCMHHIFNRVLSMDGRVLYRNEEGCTELPVNDFLGVDKIAEITEQPETDVPCYDILGRRIANPAPGQLYIQAGKKHIAK